MLCTYDGDGRRTYKRSGTDVTNYYLDGMNVVIESDGNNEIKEIYCHRLESISMVHTWDTGVQNKFYYLYDHLGNTRMITDECGNIVNVYYYDVFSECWNNTWDKANGYQFVGGYGVSVEIGLAGVGLMYMRNRYYDASTGRFLSRDSIDLWFGDTRKNLIKNIIEKIGIHKPILLHKYSYSMNNPIQYTDSYGCFPLISSSMFMAFTAVTIYYLWWYSRTEEQKKEIVDSARKLFEDPYFQYILSTTPDIIDIILFIKTGKPPRGGDPMLPLISDYVKHFNKNERKQ